MQACPLLFDLLAAYRSGQLDVREHLHQLRQQLLGDQHRSWLSVVSEQQLDQWLDELPADASERPLFGIPFAIKDNIDLQGLPTTAGCPDYQYQPQQTAFVVQQLMAAGAIPMGKTNLDQFATGLVGTRSPWGATHNSINPAYISGGSSAGSAVSVALGQVCFALGTDTAGSGRVPAAFNNIVGLKPTRGLLGCSGVVPACRSLDCVTLFANTTDELNYLLELSAQYDLHDCYARRNLAHNQARHYRPLASLAGLHIGVPHADALNFFDTPDNKALFDQLQQQLVAWGAELVTIDFQPFLDAARLLYEGAWRAERYAAIKPFITEQPESCLPEIRAIIGGAVEDSAIDAFENIYKLQAYKMAADPIVASVDAIMTPTAGTIYSITAVQADPIRLNSNLGYYTNFMNLLDYAAVALPAGFQRNGLPFGITLFSEAFSDRRLLNIAACIQQHSALPLGALKRPFPALADSALPVTPSVPSDSIELAVCGAHLSGMPLNTQLTERHGKLLATTKTSAAYRFYALSDGRPGLIRSDTGASIEVELWQLDSTSIGELLNLIPAPLGLGLGKVELCDGRWVNSFICEGYAIKDAQDITHYGGWRRYKQVTVASENAAAIP